MTPVSQNAAPAGYIEIDEQERALSVLTSPQFDVVDYAGRYQQLGKALKVDFSNILRTIAVVPACVSAANHAPIRKTIAELITSRQSRIRNLAPLIARECILQLSEPGEHDLVATVLAPYVRKTLCILSGLEMSDSAVEYHLLSGLFSQSAGIARRRRLDALLGEIWRWLDTVYSDETEQWRGARLALIILGTDATLGTLAASLHAAIPATPTRFDALQFAGAPTHTGVPYVDRFGPDTTSLQGSAAGSSSGTVRVNLAAFEAGQSGSAPHRMFGAGPHTCLGRAIATNLWRELTFEIAQLTGTIELIELEWARNDVFRVPSVFRVRVSHA